MTVYISIGNSDDKLTQQEWADYCAVVNATIRVYATAVYGEWYSLPSSTYQNACLAVEFDDRYIDKLKDRLTEIRKKYRQDSIAWAQAEPEFI